MHDIDGYFLIPISIPGVKKNGTKVLCHVHGETHFVDNLKAHMLAGNEVIGPEIFC